MTGYVYQKPFLPEGVDGYCSLACCMWVMNFFWNTQFCRQNNREMMKLMKAGNYSGYEMLDIPEIAYRLSLLGFRITYYSSMSFEQYSEYLSNPVTKIFDVMSPKYHKFIKDGFFEIPIYDIKIDLSDVTYEKKVMKSDQIKKVYDTDLLSILKQDKSDDSLFMFWVSYHILHDEPEEEGNNGGHVILVSSINENNEVIIHDPWRPTLRYYPVSFDKFSEAVLDSWEFNFMHIQYENVSSII